jgi:hypothetical protein
VDKQALSVRFLNIILGLEANIYLKLKWHKCLNHKVISENQDKLSNNYLVYLKSFEEDSDLSFPWNVQLIP